LTSSFAAQTASFTAFTASVNSFTASQLVLNGTYATTGSNTFAGIQTINSNLVVTGSITAQTLVVQTITSSVDFVTGSTRFGSILANTHVFSGSVTMNPNGLFVSSSGAVGIGLINPTQKLEVTSGSIKISSNGYGLILPGSIHTSAQINFYNANTAIELMKLPVANNTITFYANTDKLYYHSDKGSVGNFFALTTDGNVGIGTTSPEGPLHVFGTNSGGYYGIAITNYGSATSTSCGIDFGVDLSPVYNGGGNAQIKVINTSNSDNRADMTFSTYNGSTFGERLRIVSGGNILINKTTSTGGKLQVSNGTDMFNVDHDGSGAYITAVNNANTVYKRMTYDASEHVFDISATERMRLTSAGALQLNTGGPGLVTLGANNSYGAISGGSGATLYLNGGTRGGASTAGSSVAVLGLDGNFYIADSTTNTYKMVVTSAGYVVIGNTANSVGYLDINGSASSSKPTLFMAQGGYGQISTQDAYHGMILRGYPTNYTDYSATATDVMSFYEYGGEFRFYQKNVSSLTFQAKILTGNMTLTGTLTQNGSPSDINLKENLVKITSPLEKISQINGYTFDWKEGSPSRSDVLYIVEDAGLIAQEVETVLPQTVRENGDYKALNYNGISALLVEAIKELKVENDTLKEILQRNNIQ